MKATKVRDLIAALAALALIVILAAVAAVVMGKRIPILSNITDMMGL